MDNPVFVFYRIEVQVVYSPVTGCCVGDGGIIGIRSRNTRVFEEPLQIKGFFITGTEKKERNDLKKYSEIPLTISRMQHDLQKRTCPVKQILLLKYRAPQQKKKILCQETVARIRVPEDVPLYA